MLTVMRVELRAAWMAEALAWDAPEATTSLIVKGTFDLTSGAMVPAKVLLPIDDDVTSASGELYYPSDRVPQKASPEILIVGHAHSATAETAIPVSVRLGDTFVKTCSARAGTPTRAVPLLESYLRRDAASYEPVRVGPRRDIPQAWLQRRLRPGFDWSAFNAAPHDQWVPWLEPDTSLWLEGLTYGEATLQTCLPREQPSAYVCASRSAAPTAVPLSCDTLWIDVDERIACLVWRASIPRPGGDAIIIIQGADDVLVAGDDNGPPTIRRPRSTRMPAMTVDVVDKLARQGAELPFKPKGESVPTPNAPSQPPASAPPNVGERAAPPHDAGAARPPLPPHVAAAIARLQGGPDETVSMPEHTMSFVPARPKAALPFTSTSTSTRPAAPPTGDTERPPSPPPRPRTPPPLDVEETITDSVMNIAKLAASLPFTKGTGALPARLAKAIQRLEQNAEAGDTLSDLSSEERPASSSAALPFVRRDEPSAHPVPAPPAPAPEPTSSHHAPVAPEIAVDGAPAAYPQAPAIYTGTPARPTAPATPSPAPRRPRIALDRMATVRAALLDGTRLSAALDEHGIDESVWRYSDRMLRIDLAREQAEGKRTLATQLELAIVEARRARSVASPAEEQADLDIYVTVRAELDEADDPRRVLGELGMSTDRWERLRRAWTRRALTEPEVADAIRDKLAAKRRELRRLSG